MFKQTRISVACAAVLAGASAQAVPVTSLPGSTTYSFPVENYFGAGPRTVAPGITWTAATGASSVFGFTGGYAFDSNGQWSGLSMIGTNDGTGIIAMTLTFNDAVQGVGAFLNWARRVNGDPIVVPPVIAVYDAANAPLESYTLTFSTGGGANSGEFHGFQRGSSDIKSITFSGSFIGAADLQVLSTAPVPEPETYALMLGGLAALGAVVRRRKA